MAVRPQWARSLMDSELAPGASNRLIWRRSTTHSSSSGHYNRSTGRIVVTAGRSPRWEQKMVLLHEIAHAMHPGDWHSEAFYRTAFRLYRKHKLPLRKVYQRERAYHPRHAKRGYLDTRPGRVAA